MEVRPAAVLPSAPGGTFKELVMKRHHFGGVSRFHFQPFALVLAAGVLLGLALPVWAQAAELQLSVRKNIGYNNGSQIQGSFRVAASGPANLASVEFTLDGVALGTVDAAPFQIDFDTAAYAVGWHTLGATGQTADGQTLRAVDKRYEFVSASQAWASVQKIIIRDYRK